MSKATVTLKRCASYAPSETDAAVRSVVERMGGIRKFVRPGERILIKPNLLSAKEPARAITTHPEIVRPVIRMVKEAGATPVLGDSPGGAVRGVERVWEKTGMKALAAEEGIELVNFETAGSRALPIDHPLQPALHISNAVLDADGIINLPKLKTHSLMLFTGGIKNFYGCVPGLRKAEYHKSAPFPRDFARLLAELYLLVKDKVRFTLVDGIVGMEGNGPSSGDIRAMNLVAGSADTVALDTVLTTLLGFKPSRIASIGMAARKGGGIDDIRDIAVTGDPAASFALEGFKFPVTWYYSLVPRFLVNALSRFIWLKAMIIPELCAGCQMCARSCPVQAIVTGKDGKPFVDQERCISCLCCHELCPYHAVALKSSFLARRFIRQ